MSEPAAFTLDLDGRRQVGLAPADATLLSLLRDGLQNSGPKRGCNQGVCGACTVMIDGWPQRACLTLAAACEGKRVETLEGFSEDRLMASLRKHFAEGGAVQCGFCTTGMLISAHKLLQEIPQPDSDQVRQALSGNLCRCIGYRKLVEAVQAAGRECAQ